MNSLSCFERYIVNVFSHQDYVLYGDVTSYGKYIACIGKYNDPDYKSVLLHFDKADELVTFLKCLEIPHQIYLDPYHKGIAGGNL